MNSQEELKDAVKAALENRGILRDVRARLRAEVFRSLDDSSLERPPLSHANLLLNSLLSEYFQYNEYRHTESVLLAESGQSDAACLSRQFLCDELGIQPVGNAKNMPLLYSLVNFFLEKRHIPTSAGAAKPVNAAELEDEEEEANENNLPGYEPSRGSSRFEEASEGDSSARRREAPARRKDEKETRPKRDAPKPRQTSDSQSDRRASWKQEGDSIYFIQD